METEYKTQYFTYEMHGNRGFQDDDYYYDSMEATLEEVVEGICGEITICIIDTVLDDVIHVDIFDEDGTKVASADVGSESYSIEYMQ